MSDPGAPLRVARIRTPEQGKPEAPKPDDWVRAALAFALFGLLSIEVVGALWVVVRCNGTPDNATIENLKSILTLVLSPTVALFGAATGFYYGTRSETKPRP